MENELVTRARWLASGQDDPHSSTLLELCDCIEAQAARIAALIEERDQLREELGFYHEGESELIEYATCKLSDYRAIHTALQPKDADHG